MPRVSAAERREHLIQAAVRVLERDGVFGATTRRIAEEAQAPLAIVHYCFSSKDEILQAALDRVMDGMEAAVKASVRPGEGFRETLRRATTTYWTLLEGSPALELLQMELCVYGLRNEGSRELVRHQYARYQRLCEDILRAAAAASDVRTAIPTDQLGRLLLAALDGLAVQYITERNAARARKDLSRFLDLLLEAAGPSRPQRPKRPRAPASKRS